MCGENLSDVVESDVQIMRERRWIKYRDFAKRQNAPWPNQFVVLVEDTLVDRSFHSSSWVAHSDSGIDIGSVNLFYAYIQLGDFFVKTIVENIVDAIFEENGGILRVRIRR